MAEIAHVKRLLERWEGDSDFRARLRQDPAAAAREHGLQADPLATRPIWDLDCPKDWPIEPVVERYSAFVREKYAHREELRRRLRPDNANFHAWRLRQMVRTTSQLGAAKAHGIVHPMAAFELSKGCSVGCWFCGVSAPKLGDLFLYNPENRALWREVCAVWRQEIGSAAEHAFLYWATDPMDNPDYERFACDFHELCGYFPQTTTALPLRDVERTRKLLRLSEERGCLLNRFSIISPKIFEGVHQTFSAEELTFVELVMQASKDTASKAVAGRARQRAMKRGEEDLEASTIACISGFLVQMVERSLKLITPCPASQRWPLGYVVHGQRSFHDGPSFARALRELCADSVMPPTASALPYVGLRSDLTCSLEETGLSLKSPHMTQNFRGLSHHGLERLSQLLLERRHRAGELAISVQSAGSDDLATIFLVLNQMLSHGVLEEEQWLTSS